jgi:hypothetical protein
MYTESNILFFSSYIEHRPPIYKHIWLHTDISKNTSPEATQKPEYPFYFNVLKKRLIKKKKNQARVLAHIVMYNALPYII